MKAPTAASRPARSGRRREFASMVVGASLPLLAVTGALLIGAWMLVLLDADPITAYGALIEGAFGSTSGIAQSLVKATPLLLVGIGICIAFRASVINIGAEGQIIMGAVMVTWFSLQFRDLPGWFLIPAALVMGFIGGAFWGFIPGILKARMGVNEILSTVMMNAIALQFMNFMIRGPLIDPAGVASGQYLAQSEKLPEQVWLARLIPQTQLHTGLLVAIVLAFVVYILLWRTTIGYRIRAVGLNPDASRYAGIKVSFHQAFALTAAGGLAGVAGAVEVMGVHHRLLDGVSGGYGFSGIVAALFGGLHPLGTIPASYLFGSLLTGADTMQREVQVPSALISAILGLVVLFVVGSQYWSQKRASRRVDTPPTAPANAGPGEIPA